MKQTLSTFIIALLVASNISAYDFQAGDLFYNITDETNKTVEVTYEMMQSPTNYSLLPEEVIIPETVINNETEYSVTGIGRSAFAMCSKLKQITIPDGVLVIKEQAFFNCSALNQINIGTGVENIKSQVFFGCRKLAEVTIPDGVTVIGDYIFNSCSALTKVNIGSGLTKIGEKAFDNCMKLTEINVDDNNTVYSSESGVLFSKDKTELIIYPIGKQETAYTIPEGVISISNSAFYKCPALTQVSIPNGVESIGEEAFSTCSALEHINIPESIFSIGKYAFYNTPVYNNAEYWINDVMYLDNCLIEARTSLTDSYDIAEGTKVIANAAFSNCASLTEINIPNSLINIGNEAFIRTGISKITIPENVTNIGNDAFNRCASLTEVNTGNGVTKVGDRAFSGCPTLANVTIGDNVTSIGIEAFSKCSSLSEITIPDCVTSIGDAAFSWCLSLTSVSFGSGITNIGESAFYPCSSLTEMTITATVPPTINANVFEEVPREIPVYVPEESLESYKEAEVWKEFDLQAIPTSSIQNTKDMESINVHNGILSNPEELQIYIYDLQGRQVYSGNDVTLRQPSGIYIIRCADKCIKAAF